MAEKPYDFLPPGGQFQNLIGSDIATVVTSTIAPDKMVHHVKTSATINTITPPHEGYTGPLYLIADSVFAVGGTGNIASTQNTVKVANHAYGFLYDRVAGKWYELAGQL